MSFSTRFNDIRTGFERPFWIANISEIFERVAYYGAFASLALYLQDKLHFSTQATGTLTGIFGGMVWFLAIFGGAVADRLGFRRALSLAYLILAVAYFLIGSIAAPWLAPARNALGSGVFVAIILMLPALGVAMVKPSVVGTTARASKENVRSIGYSIYYTMVNIGGALGPLFAGWAHAHLGLENVYRIVAIFVFAMFFFVLLLFREPKRAASDPQLSVRQVTRNFFTVLGNFRFMLFLIIFSGFWIVYWQMYIVMPVYLAKYVLTSPETSGVIERVIVTDGVTVMCLTIIINLLTRKMKSFAAVIVGTLISSLSWLILANKPAIWAAVLTLFVLAIGEIIQQPRYYEYISRLAPPGQQGTYMGFAFLPIGIGSLVGGPLGGWLLTHFAEHGHPTRVWYAISGIGVLTTLLLWIYDRASRNGNSTTVTAAQ